MVIIEKIYIKCDYNIFNNLLKNYGFSSTLLTLKLLSFPIYYFFLFLYFFASLWFFFDYRKQSQFCFWQNVHLISIYFFSLFILIMFNINNARVFYLDDSFFSSLFNNDFFSNKFINLLSIFGLIFLIILYNYFSQKLLVTSLNI